MRQLARHHVDVDEGAQKVMQSTTEGKINGNNVRYCGT
jgi:hypothetical protein